MTTTTAQLVILGAGPGGYTAAFYAADLGINVTLIDKDPNLGGVCLNRGCIPSKALLHTAKIIDEAKSAQHLGVTFSEPEIDLDKIRSFKEGVVKKLTRGLAQLSKARNIQVIHGTASLKNNDTLEVINNDNTKTEIQFKNLIIATGSTPITIPGVSTDIEGLWDATSALNISKIPKSLLVIGGGYIGLELGSVYASLGTEVSVIEMMAGILPGADTDLTTPLQRRLKKKFKQLLFESKVTGIEKATNGILVKYTDKANETKEQTYENVLFSLGRKPDTKGLNLENAGIETTEKGFIKVKPNRQTTNTNIYAIGDISGNPMLAHKASHEAHIAVDAILGKDAAFAPQAIPAVVFTDPEIAWCGITETEAQQQNLEITVTKFPWIASGRALSLNRTEGLTKLIVDTKTEKVLGVGIVGPGAGDLISEGVLAIEMGATAKSLKNCIHPHPTLSETVMEAAELFYGHCAHLYKKR